MTYPIPANISTGTVRGQFQKSVLTAPATGDGVPDALPLTALKVTFSPSVKSVIDRTASPNPVSIAMVPIVCSVDSSGYVLNPEDGSRAVKLIATNDPDIDPHGDADNPDWTYYVTFSGTPESANFEPFSMNVPSGSDRWITNIAPVPSSTGVSLSQALAAEAAAVAAASTASASASAAAASAVTAVAATTTKVDKGSLVINVRDYGVLGNGTDETTTIQAALDAGAGKTVYFPPGTYGFNIIYVSSNSTVYGVRGATILAPIGNGSAAMNRLRMFNVTGVTLRDFTIGETGSLSRTGVYGAISANTCTDIRIDNVEVKASSSTGMHFMAVTGLTITRCWVHDTQADGIHMQRGCTNVVISDTKCNDNGDDCIGFVSHSKNLYGYCKDINITNCILGSQTATKAGSGIALIGCFGATVTGNTISNTALSGIRVSSIDEGGSDFSVVGNVLISGNRIVNSGVYSGVTPGVVKDGISVFNARNVTVTGNIIDKTVAAGVAIGNCGIDVTVTNNQISRTGTTGVNAPQLEQAGNYLELWTHTELTDGRTKTYVAFHDLTVSNNRVTSAGTNGVSVTGAASRYVEGLTVHRNKIRNSNTTGAGSLFGINTSYVDGLDLSGNDVGDPPTTAITKYSTPNTLNTVISNNLPTTTTQATYLNSRAHTYGSAIPTSGTYELGAAVWNSNPQSAGVLMWACAAAGTMGTLGAITGSITSGLTLLTVSAITGLSSGAYITIAGVTGKKKIMSITGLVLTLDSAASATVSGAAVAYSAASFRVGSTVA